MKNWIKVLILFYLLFNLTFAVFILTSNPILFPTVSLLSTLIVPITFIVYLKESKPKVNITNFALGVGFILGGFLGILATAFLEPLLISRLNLQSIILIGLIEEGAKMLAVIVIFIRSRYKKKNEGILIGVSVGMGFSILENLGYIFVAFLTTLSLNFAVVITLLRGIVAPLGHGTWSAIAAGFLFEHSSVKHFHLNPRVLFAYFLVSFFHSLWNAIPLFLGVNLSPFYILAGQILLIIAGFLVLFQLWQSKVKTKIVPHTAVFIKRR